MASPLSPADLHFVRRSTRRKTTTSFFLSSPDELDGSSRHLELGKGEKETSQLKNVAVALPKKRKLPPTKKKIKKNEKTTILKSSTSKRKVKDQKSSKNRKAVPSSPPNSPKKKRTRSPSPPLSSKRSNISSSASSKNNAIIYSTDVAKIAPQNKWIDLQIPPSELRPSATLTTGQCFNWIVVTRDDVKSLHGGSGTSSTSAWGTHNETEWIGPLHANVLSIRELPNTTLCRVLHGPTDNIVSTLHSYFQVHTKPSLSSLYQQWSANDTNRMAKIAKVIPGVRILRQDPIECLFSFICSSNNNIPRITKMLSVFRKAYGVKMLDVPTHWEKEDSDTTTDSSLPLSPPDMEIYSFPTLQDMKQATDEDLRAMGLGYRAKYIIQTRDLLLQSGGLDHLLHLRTNIQDSETVQEELMKFSGIGRKVADCVALFSLDQCDAIPVDVHVQHIASRDYDPTVLNGSVKSLTPTIYRQVGDLFRQRFPVRAGWAHSLLFVAELPSFRDVLPAELVLEMDEWREKEKAKKAAEKKTKANQKVKAT